MWNRLKTQYFSNIEPEIATELWLLNEVFTSSQNQKSILLIRKSNPEAGTQNSARKIHKIPSLVFTEQAFYSHFSEKLWKERSSYRASGTVT